MKPVIIIGTGLAGYTLARELRKIDGNVPLVIVTADNGGFYSKPMLSNALALGKSASDLASHQAEKMAAQLHATILTSTRVTNVDSAARLLTTSKGGLGYGKLVLAVGASPIRLQLEGNAADEVMSVNHLDHYAAFRKQLGASSKRIIILGAGLIGCEFADDLASAGHQVTLVDPQPLPLASIAPPDISHGLAQALTARAVALRLGQRAVALDRTRGELELRLAGGETITADLVLSAVGLRADLGLAQSAGLQTGRGILVDTFGKTSVEDIYALGDCAEYRDEHGDGHFLPYVAPLMNAARAIAITLAGTPTPISLKPAPVLVKTPSYPIALVPAPLPARATGRWHSTREGGKLIARFYDAAGIMRGFGLSQHDMKTRQALLEQLGKPG